MLPVTFALAAAAALSLNTVRLFALSLLASSKPPRDNKPLSLLLLRGIGMSLGDDDDANNDDDDDAVPAAVADVGGDDAVDMGAVVRSGLARLSRVSDARPALAPFARTML